MSASRRLRTARRRRSQIATQIDALRKGQITLDELLTNTPACLRNVSIYYVMRHTPKLGPDGIKRCLKKADVWPEDKLGDIDDLTKQKVVDCLPPRVQRFRATP